MFFIWKKALSGYPDRWAMGDSGGPDSFFFAQTYWSFVFPST